MYMYIYIYTYIYIYIYIHTCISYVSYEIMVIHISGRAGPPPEGGSAETGNAYVNNVK